MLRFHICYSVLKVFFSQIEQYFFHSLHKWVKFQGVAWINRSVGKALNKRAPRRERAHVPTRCHKVCHRRRRRRKKNLKRNGHLKTHTCNVNEKYLHHIPTNFCSVLLNYSDICWKMLLKIKLQGFSNCASFHIPPLRSTRPMTMKKKKVGWGEELNHGKDMCCSLISLRTPKEDLWRRRGTVSTDIFLLYCILIRLNGESASLPIMNFALWLLWFVFLALFSSGGSDRFKAYFLRRLINFAPLASLSIVVPRLSGPKGSGSPHW